MTLYLPPFKKALHICFRKASKHPSQKVLLRFNLVLCLLKASF